MFEISFLFQTKCSIFVMLKENNMVERQEHGFLYEKEIIEKNNIIKDDNYTGKWDSYENGKPVSIKCIKQGSSIDFGDFKRQSEVDKYFILYVGFWYGNKNNIVESYKVLIKKENWVSYFGDVNIIQSMLTEMKEISNERSDDLKWKSYREKYGKLYGDSIIALRFKRDHKKQKRIQCGITYTNFKNVVLKNNQLM